LSRIIRYRVVGLAEDLAGALVTADREQPDLALIDLQLARGSTGFSVAARLNAAGIPCLFVSGKPPGFAMPDLALGCLLKPFTGEDVHRTLATAENMMRGRETLRPRLPATSPCMRRRRSRSWLRRLIRR
jgi:DNA-binding response OmpR family regulator